MLQEGAQRLANDHDALKEILSELRRALNRGDLAQSYFALDRFWACLAIHIRAEHLHLFPAILNLVPSMDDEMTDWSLPKAENLIAQLRADHDFFMKKLGGAMLSMRRLIGKEPNERLAELSQVRETVSEIEGRLQSHNDLEENEVYKWVGFLSAERQDSLAKQIAAELKNLPQRFK